MLKKLNDFYLHYSKKNKIDMPKFILKKHVLEITLLAKKSNDKIFDNISVRGRFYPLC